MLPARFFTPPPPNPRPKVVKIIPCDGVDICFARRNVGDLACSEKDPSMVFTRTAWSYALVELPCGKRVLDAFVSADPMSCSERAAVTCLASELHTYGPGCGKWKFMTRPKLLPLAKPFRSKIYDKDGQVTASRDMHLLEVSRQDPPSYGDPRGSYSVEALDVAGQEFPIAETSRKKVRGWFSGKYGGLRNPGCFVPVGSYSNYAGMPGDSGACLFRQGPPSEDSEEERDEDEDEDEDVEGA